MCDAQHIGWTALHGAAYNGHVSVAIHLIEAGSDISATSSVCSKCPYVYLEYALSIDVLGKIYRTETRLFITP